jgi:hypothetical protein
MILDLLLLSLLLLQSQGSLASPDPPACVPPDATSRPSYLVPGFDPEHAGMSGNISFERPSPRGLELTAQTANDYVGSYTLVAVITNGHGLGDTLTGRLTLHRPAGAFSRSSPGAFCSASGCRDTTWTIVDTFDLVGLADSRLAAWPLVAMTGIGSRDFTDPGIEASIEPGGLLRFSLGHGLHGEDGPPRFTVTEVVPPELRGWWSEGAPITHPSGGHFCMVRLP